MGASPKYPSPLQQLSELMVAARREGVPFEEFWTTAVRPELPLVMVTTLNPPEGCVRWPTDRNDRVTWKGAILGSKDGWRRVYERQPPTKEEAAIAFLAPDGAESFEALAEVAEMRQRAELGDGFECDSRLPSAA